MAFDWKITLKKGLIQFAIAFISIISTGLITVYGNNQYYIILAPIINGCISAILNWLKHRKDE